MHLHTNTQQCPSRGGGGGGGGVVWRHERRGRGMEAREKGAWYGGMREGGVVWRHERRGRGMET